MVSQTKYLGGDSSNSLAKEYEERSKYISRLKELQVPVINTLYEKKLYGHLDRESNIVVPPNTPVSFGDYAPGVDGIGYVVAMFEKFRDFYFNISSVNDSIGVPSIISDLVPSKSFVSLDSEYSFNKGQISDLIYEILNDRVGNSFLNLEEFVDLVNDTMFLSDFENFKLTKSGYSLTNCYFTGLYVDMSKNYQPHLDLIKGQLIEDPNFKCYCAFAQEHGFLVDASSPWRLVVDLESDVARKTILNGRPMEQFEDFYSDVYSLRVAYDDFWEIEIFYQFLYNQYIMGLRERGVSIPTLSLYRASPSTISSDISPTRTKIWLKSLIINKLREFGLIRSIHDFSNFHEIYDKSVDILNNTTVQLSGARVGILNNPSSPLGFVNKEFTKIIKDLV